MLYLLSHFHVYFGPLRLFQSFTVLIGISLYLGFCLTAFILPKMYRFLPKDRGREFTLTPEAAAGKPTGGGVVFISIFVLMIFILIIPSVTQIVVLILTWLAMLTGYLDDKADVSWGEYKKGALDFLLSIATTIVLYHFYFHDKVSYWVPFITGQVSVHPVVFFIISTIIIWTSINTTNCTDGVDGLSSTLVLMALLSLGVVFYFLLGNIKVSEYLLIPFIQDGAQWALLSFSLSGVLMGYLWHNAFPSSVLMGDAGSRALGFFIGVLVLVSGNPFLLLMTSSVILINGGTGLLKIVMLRFFHIKIFSSIRFPLHDHMRKSRKWSPMQVQIKFMIIQLLITIAVLGLLFKLR
ncbi:hypothetical protein [Treponema phagedenis]|uniref:Phospho-N-acetylmuramoyl-pentapeptide-transferase n=1 Tax=Treponema phagedenis TaxID=162 RepID=A0AAE6IXJ0_TREPH|nr:hypothetical protein [Treponema phagedenis]NVP24075.1 phospho-N-acetylmuramoyl-pentapeptide-transferase [Treponema phagedenis]QEJ99357.1 phospho-N-acetylmuramoyl-pentapeptide-transferase [Treponema phagedenis]QEJ99994.1 phospho-N-acetylmuramoyl-pentapeptide-transferase [Treponema phagedenis]QEK04928.1 phospho-N-acetylmuramoyl-pentapeptide-transferase [Treponema phagedenis]QEK07453.1 phospho-N-acetylmuramoyl-pentapeptide-transferase [Treponema phagedenis]